LWIPVCHCFGFIWQAFFLSTEKAKIVETEVAANQKKRLIVLAIGTLDQNCLGLAQGL
jgi:hypothetical protein